MKFSIVPPVLVLYLGVNVVILSSKFGLFIEILNEEPISEVKSIFNQPVSSGFY